MMCVFSGFRGTARGGGGGGGASIASIFSIEFRFADVIAPRLPHTHIRGPEVKEEVCTICTCTYERSALSSE